MVAKSPAARTRVVVHFASLAEADAFVASMSTHPKPLAPEPLKSVRRLAKTYRAEVLRMPHGPIPYRWSIYARGEAEPIAQSGSGYASETDAWSAAAAVMMTLRRQQRATSQNVRETRTPERKSTDRFDPARALAGQ